MISGHGSPIMAIPNSLLHSYAACMSDNKSRAWILGERRLPLLLPIVLQLLDQQNRLT